MRNLTGLVFAVAIIATAPMASAKQSLRDVKAIDDGLFALAIANEIRENCGSVSARMIKAYSFLKSLESQAKSMGYSDAEIRSHIKSDTEKARMRKIGEAYLKDNGVDRSDPETFCALGRAEIEKSSQIGALLRAK